MENRPTWLHWWNWQCVALTRKPRLGQQAFVEQLFDCMNFAFCLLSNLEYELNRCCESEYYQMMQMQCNDNNDNHDVTRSCDMWRDWLTDWLIWFMIHLTDHEPFEFESMMLHSCWEFGWPSVQLLLQSRGLLVAFLYFRHLYRTELSRCSLVTLVHYIATLVHYITLD